MQGATSDLQNGVVEAQGNLQGGARVEFPLNPGQEQNFANSDSLGDDDACVYVFGSERAHRRNTITGNRLKMAGNNMKCSCKGPVQDTETGSLSPSKADSDNPSSSQPVAFPSTTEEASECPVNLNRGSIRFLPRVRITSGLNRSKRTSSLTNSPITPKSTISGSNAHSVLSQLHQEHAILTSPPVSVTSTRSSSISSSISAPLRFRENEAVPSKWGPLGQRVSLFAAQHRTKRMFDPNDPKVNSRMSDDERTPLLRHHQHLLQRRVYDQDSDYEILLNREIDRIFGKWPGRLINRHWWWWQLEPILCCWCLGDAVFDDD